MMKLQWNKRKKLQHLFRNQVKAKLSDEQLCKAEYNPCAESVRILEGVDPLEELQRRVLI